MNYKSFADQIVKMKNVDLAFRDKLIQSGELSNGYNAEMEQIHIEEIIRQHALSENQFPPADFQARKIQYEEWRKRVGWIK